MAKKDVKWKGKRHRVGEGDIVQFRAQHLAHAYGAFGIVVGYIGKHKVIVKTMGGTDRDFLPTYVTVYDCEPNENYIEDGENKGHKMWYYGIYIEKVIHRVAPKPPKRRKPLRFHEVTHEDLPAVLGGVAQVPDGHKVVLVNPPIPQNGGQP